MEKRTCGDDLDELGNISTHLCKLKMATEYAQEFGKKFSKYMSQEDKVEMAKLNSRYDFMYRKYWEKLVQKIRGL